MPERQLKATISGSFNRHYEGIRETVETFLNEEISVLSPKPSRIRSRRRNFVRLESDNGTPGEIEMGHLTAIASSDFLYVYNPDGYVGPSTGLEIGFALSKGLPVFSLKPADDEVFSSLTEAGVPIATIEKRLLE